MSVVEALRESQDELQGDKLIYAMDERLDAVFDEQTATEGWRVLMDPKTDPELVRLIMRELYLEVAWYQADVIEATIHVIGQLPRHVSAKTIQSMLIHQADEFDHGEMAIRDYVRLGGDETYARTSRMSPSAHAVAAYWVMLAHKRDPFAYLGALYMFEGLTPRTSAALLGALNNDDFPRDATEFAEFHATEDIKHQNLVKHLIKDVAKKHPESVPAMFHGIDCFSNVFPVPVIESGYNRARAAFNGSTA